MSKSSRDKGARGEREAAAVLSALTGLPWCRSANQSQRGKGGRVDADIICVDPVTGNEVFTGLHIEVKRGKVVRWNPAMKQAQADIRQGAKTASPMVLGREDHNEWFVMVRLRDIPGILEGIRASQVIWGAQTCMDENLLQRIAEDEDE